MENEQAVSGGPRRSLTPVLVGLAVLALAVAGYLIKHQAPEQENAGTDTGSQQEANVSPDASPADTGTATPSSAPAANSEVKTFTVIGSNFSFAPSQLKVKKGDTVKIIFKNEDGFHDWVIDEFNARTNRIQGGQTDEVQFVADKAGSFEYYCSVGEHRARGMKGTLTVE